MRTADGSLFGTLCATSRQQQPYNLEGEQVMGLFAKLISHYVEKDTTVATAAGGKRRAGAALVYR